MGGGGGGGITDKILKIEEGIIEAATLTAAGGRGVFGPYAQSFSPSQLINNVKY